MSDDDEGEETTTVLMGKDETTTVVMAEDEDTPVRAGSARSRTRYV